MKIKYEFADGDVEVDVPNEWASILVELDRLERNNEIGRASCRERV